MNATNRFTNRLLLAVTGIVLLAVAAVIALLTLRPNWAATLIDAVESFATTLWTELGQGVIPFGDERSVPLLPVIAGVLGLLLLVVMIAFLATRGGGRVSNVVRELGGAGANRVDASVVDGTLGESLRQRSDLLGVQTQLYRVATHPSVRLTLTARRGADLAEVLHGTDRAIAEWDALLGRKVPIIVHCKDRGVFNARRAPTRVQ